MPTMSTQVEEIVQKWQAAFTKPTNSEAEKQVFLSLYHPDIVWTDHAFHVQRHGHQAVLGLQKAFNHCNQPFRSDTKAVHPTNTGAVVECVWVGECVNDIVRPDGEVAVKSLGKEFKNHVCFVIEIDKDGLIRKIDEYYNKIWEDGIPQDMYKRINGPSMKL